MRIGSALVDIVRITVLSFGDLQATCFRTPDIATVWKKKKEVMRDLQREGQLKDLIDKN
jgi:hypothetical protein